ncbi:MAG TPA: type II toxin-antitoxin system VapC family toxin [Candidatus Acidoferrales bacterium]|nr:type II toxin-antitoxin system VapC family toxin [Candidatus Acidoferrales bacterium]
MIRFVLDASVSLRWFLDNPVPAYALKVRKALTSGSRALVPALWHLEMANAFVVAERRRILSAGDTDLFLDQVELLLGQSIESESVLLSLRNAVSLARPFGLTSYDSACLETARRNKLPLATLDRSLQFAAAKAGVSLFR